MAAPADLTFLAPPGEVADWRLVLLFDAVAASGALAALPATLDELAADLGLDRHGLRVTLDALAAWGVVAREGDDHYRPGPEAPDASEAAALRHHARALRQWAATVDHRLRGAPPEVRPGMPDPELFLDGLAVGARRAAPAVVDLCLARFPAARSVLDLGGGHGEYSLEFARRGLQATMQDLPTMAEIVARRGVLAEAGVELVAGSFFDAVPDGPFDLAFCAGITHTFDGAHNQALYRRLRPVVAPGGGVAVVTMLRHRHPLADVFAVQMLANANGGDTHGEDEYRAWLGQAGFAVDEAPVDVRNRPQSVLFAT
ncbi:MAG: methyltransferase [Acidimicrobiales bacterium]